MKRKCLLLFLVVVLLFSVPSTSNGSDQLKRVLYISSYTESFDPVPLQIQGVREAFATEAIQLDIEYMDTKRLPAEENIQLFYEWISYKLAHVEPYDAVLAGDDSALQFALDYQEELFADLPIVFLAVNDYNRAMEGEKRKNMTGIFEEMPFKENIELALAFNPKATKIIGIIDSTYTGIGDFNQFHSYERDFPNLEFISIDSSEYTFEEMAALLSKIEEDSLLFYLSMYFDKNGSYISIDDAAKFFHSHARVPVYRASVGGVGHGLLGGKMLQYDEMGKMAGEMMKAVLKGADIDAISMVTEPPSQYVMDYQLVQDFRLDMKAVPEGTHFVNKKVSFYQLHRDLVLKTVAVIAVLALFSIFLFVDNLRRRRIERILKEGKDKLAHANEELTVADEEMREQYGIIQEHAEKIKMLNDKYNMAMRNIDGVVWELNSRTMEVYVSENIKNVFDGDIQEVEDIFRLINTLFQREERRKLIREYINYKRKRKSQIDIQLKITKGQHTKWVIIRGGGIADFTGREVMLCGLLMDVTKSVEQDLHIKHFARHDYLTNLPNRMSLTETLKKDVAEGRPLSVLMLDLDNFKEINDTLGHGQGDNLLKEIADRFRQISSDKMQVYRFGGDEFLLILPNETERERIEGYVQKVDYIFHQPFIIQQKEYKVEYSMGIARFPLDSKNTEELFMNADTAMYKVKTSGKNGYLFYDNQMKAAIQEKTRIERILRSALKNDGFTLAYQPKVWLKTGEIIGFEGLLRLKNYRIPPNVFIRIAEESNLIIEIGRKITEDAILQLVKWKDMGYKPKTVSINFSSKQIKDAGYIEFLRGLLEKHQIDPQCFEIEITESILLEQTDSMMAFLYDLKDIGIRLALDDFGTGYSSLYYLTYLPVDHIKLDKSLCDKFLDLENVKVMDSIISLGHSLGMEITAEGVENENQVQRLRDANCDYIQGYYFSIPLTGDEVSGIYDKNFFED